MNLVKHLLSASPQEPHVMKAPIKYVYLDIVGFTQNRSVEAQSDLIAKLNSLFRDAINQFNVKPKDHIFIPTGDGICLALIETQGRDYDIHLKIALKLLARIHDYNESTPDKTRQLFIRIGINENVDNLITDINGKPNVAGLGVNMAQRIMSNADENQILVGHAVFERLRARQQYMQSFQQFDALVKHAEHIAVYQYRDDGAKGLNNNIPRAFAPKATEESKLTTLAAHYFALAILNRNFFYSIRMEPVMEYAAVVFYYLTALDIIGASEASEFASPPLRLTWGDPTTPIEKQYAHYAEQDFAVMSKLATLISRVYLAPYGQFFEKGEFNITSFVFVKPAGMEKLNREWPDVVRRFALQG